MSPKTAVQQTGSSISNHFFLVLAARLRKKRSLLRRLACLSKVSLCWDDRWEHDEAEELGHVRWLFCGGGQFSFSHTRDGQAGRTDEPPAGKQRGDRKNNKRSARSLSRRVTRCESFSLPDFVPKTQKTNFFLLLRHICWSTRFLIWARREEQSLSLLGDFPLPPCPSAFKVVRPTRVSSFLLYESSSLPFPPTLLVGRRITHTLLSSLVAASGAFSRLDKKRVRQSVDS